LSTMTEMTEWFGHCRTSSIRRGCLVRKECLSEGV